MTKNETQAEEISRLRKENEALRAELLTPDVFSRLAEWLKAPRSATAAFTAGIERQIAYALEMDVLPEVKSLRIKLERAEKTIETMRRGEFICNRCGLRKDSDLDSKPDF